MTVEKISELLQKGEGIDVEFKTAQYELNKDTFDSICAFLNRKGGHLLLGVNNNGKVDGVLETSITSMVNNLITSANNTGKLNPVYYLSPQVLNYEDKKIIYVYIPESSQVHSTNGKIFDRNGDADLDITRHTSMVTDLYLRKRLGASEDLVFPYVEYTDLEPTLFDRVREMAALRIPGHPWSKMSNEAIIHSAGMYKKDPRTGSEGITLAAALLFGKDNTIMNVLPYHKTDALLRVENLDRYDDRDDIRTNLIDSYDRLMAFIAKHLPDRFYLEGIQSISIRDKLFREIISNLLIHREFSSRFPAKLIIEREQVYTENWSIPNNMGQIDPLNFTPRSKNPAIAKVFKEIGRMDELGSGVRNVFRYAPEYTPGTTPQLIEADVFKTSIPIRLFKAALIPPPSDWEEVRRKVRRKFGEKFGESSEKILELIFHNQHLSAVDIAQKITLSPRAVEKQLAKLKDLAVIERIGPDKGGYWKITDISPSPFTTSKSVEKDNTRE